MHTVYISLGSNVGHRIGYLQRGFTCLKAEVLNAAVPSIILETPALLLPDSPPDWNRHYLNMVVRGQTDLEPQALLDALKKIEQRLGRDLNAPRWSPRTLDLDILLYGTHCLQTERLTIPHPELSNRWFLLHLLALLDPELRDPRTQARFSDQASQTVPPHPFTRSLVLHPRCMGILNITPDSFSDGGLYLKPDAAIAHAHQLFQEGASIVDLGAQSTRPGAVQLSEEEEWKRLHPVLKALSSSSIPISVDTYQSPVIVRLLERYPIAWINTFPHLVPDDTLTSIAGHGCSICIMHALSVPVQKGEQVESLQPTLNNWIQQQVERLTHLGFTTNKVILDLGVGFGKTGYQTGPLIKNYGTWASQWGCPVLLGHSRKSYLSAFSPYAVHQRDTETVAISLALKNQVDYIRVHNVALHQRALVAQQWLESCDAH